MARTLAELPAGSRITDYISLGVIAKFFPAEKIHQVLEQTHRASVRERDLPAHVVVDYVIALALYMRSSYREVLRCLLEGLQWLLDPSAKVRVAGKSGISQARTRLGAAPLKKLYDAVVAPIAEKCTKGAWYRQWRLVSLDGSTLDVADTAAVDGVVENINNEFGAPTILINNAGITRDNLLMRMKEEEWSDIINTNLTSVFRVSKACLRGMMKARKGRIISIASVVGATGNPGQANYAAAKAGIIGFTKSLAREVASRNITVNAVAPGFIDTDMTRGLPEDQKQQLLQQIPLQRLGLAEEIAAAVGFLASPSAAYITGQTLHVNGGMYMN